MPNNTKKWVYLIALSLVWGSSFILMKYALLGLNPIQVGSLRIIITTLVLLLFGFKSLFELNAKNWLHVAVSAVLGTLIPVFLFAVAINNMDSAIAAILNSFVPFNALIIGALVFGFTFQKNQIFGILIGLIGTILLIINGHSVTNIADYKYPAMILLASVGYAFNANIVKRYLQEVRPLAITTGTFAIVLIPALIILIKTDFFETVAYNETTKESLFYIAILSIVGTAIAKVFFNKLLQISSPIFSTSVTYLIPIVAVFWGFLDGERLTFTQILSGMVILFGVFLVNRAKK
jgi:drug/metabolite transporter (DMT)-like permease